MEITRFINMPDELRMAYTFIKSYIYATLFLLFTEQRPANTSEQSHEKRYLCFTFTEVSPQSNYIQYDVYVPFWVLLFFRSNNKWQLFSVQSWGFSVMSNITIHLIRYVTSLDHSKYKWATMTTGLLGDSENSVDFTVVFYEALLSLWSRHGFIYMMFLRVVLF